MSNLKERQAPTSRMNLLFHHDDMCSDVLAISIDARWVATTKKSTILMWALGSDLSVSCAGTLSGHSGKVLTLTFSADGRFLASCDANMYIHVWNIATKKCKVSFSSGYQIVRLNFFLKGHRLAGLTLEGKLQVWSADFGDVINSSRGANIFSCLLSSADDRLVLAADQCPPVAGRGR